MRFATDNEALQWCVEHDVHVRIDPIPNSMEPYVVTLIDKKNAAAGGDRFRVTVFREAVQRFTAKREAEHG